MKTVIFKWNPSFSSFSMFDFLQGMVEANFPGNRYILNWSAWDHKDINPGDRYYFLKLGPAGTGIIGRGVVMSEPWPGEDWSGKGRDTYYVDLDPEIFLNPDSLPILTTEELEANIPGFEWDRGHSGVIIADDMARKLDALWESFVAKNAELFNKKDVRGNDMIYRKKGK